LVDVVREPRVKTIIVEDVGARKNIARKIFLEATLKKDPTLIEKRNI
jgi:hypothetical protein